MFKELPLSGLKPPRTHTRWTFLVSLAAELLVLGVLLLIPLIYVGGLPAGWHEIEILPPVPESAPAQPVEATPVTRASSSSSPWIPTFVPPRAIPSPGASPGNVSLAVTGPGLAVPGIPGGPPNGGWRSLFPEPGPAAPAAAKGNSSSAPIRKGGDVELGLLLRKVQPDYPEYARDAGIQGTVVLDAIITPDGKVESVKYLSGPPILVRAAEDAVRQWLFKPTLLNGQPVSVETIIKVIFTLAGSGGTQPPDPASRQIRL